MSAPPTQSKSPGTVAMVRSINPNYRGFDYLSWYVGNARQAASFFVTRFGFRVTAYRGPETGSHLVASYVVSNGNSILVFMAPIRSPEDLSDERASEEDRKLIREIHAHLTKHGDGVKDIAFQVDDVSGVWQHAVDNGATSVQAPVTLKEEKVGEVVCATIKTYGDTTHTLVNRSQYKGAFLPGFKRITAEDPINEVLPKVDLIETDHCVGNQGWGGLDGIVK